MENRLLTTYDWPLATFFNFHEIKEHRRTFLNQRTADGVQRIEKTGETPRG
jgi:hypothetical protein